MAPRRGMRACIVALVVAGNLTGCGPDPQTQLCDSLAASDLDPTRPEGLPGVSFEHVDGVKAVEACAAVAANSNNPRHWFQYGRALDAIDRPVEAFDWYLKAARAGHGVAQSNLGLMYDNGKGVAKDDAQAVAWYRKAAEQGYAVAQSNLGLMYDNGKGVAKDDAQAVAWYRKAAEQGHAVAQSNLGLMYANGQGIAKDDALAVAWFRKAAEQGHAAAQDSLGIMYANGQGVAKDDAQAVAWYRKAAEQGYAAAQNNLGVMYANGHGVAKDDAQAVAWYRKAAEQGLAVAQSNLGLMYANGHGVAKDDAQAVAWFRKAAEQGYANAQFNLGLMYANGHGVAKDDALAVAWFRKVAEQGYTDAQNNLGYMYEMGRGVPKDPVQAMAWYRAAVKSGSLDAVENIKRMERAQASASAPQNTTESLPGQPGRWTPSQKSFRDNVLNRISGAGSWDDISPSTCTAGTIENFEESTPSFFVTTVAKRTAMSIICKSQKHVLVLRTDTGVARVLSSWPDTSGSGFKGTYCQRGDGHNGCRTEFKLASNNVLAGTTKGDYYKLSRVSDEIYRSLEASRAMEERYRDEYRERQRCHDSAPIGSTMTCDW